MIGCGGHAKSVVDSIERTNQYEIVGFSDVSDFSYKKYRVICCDEDLPKIFQSGVENAFITIGYMGNGRIRDKLYQQLKAIGFKIPSIIDDTAIIAKDASVGEGTFVGKGAIINSAANIGIMGIINSGAIVEHECRIGDYSHIAVKAALCGGCCVGNHCLVGANSTIIQTCTLGNNVIIGAGSVVLSDVTDNIKCYGTVDFRKELQERC